MKDMKKPAKGKKAVITLGIMLKGKKPAGKKAGKMSAKRFEDKHGDMPC